MGLAGESGSGGGLFSRRNVAVAGVLVALVAGGWYGYWRYQQSSGAALRARMLRGRNEQSPEQSLKKAKPEQKFYTMLDKLSLTAEQRAKVDATRDLPLDKEGWTQRKKALAETLTKEQLAQLKRMYGGGDARWRKSVGNMSEADQRAIARRMEGIKKEGGKKEK